MARQMEAARPLSMWGGSGSEGSSSTDAAIGATGREAGAGLDGVSQVSIILNVHFKMIPVFSLVSFSHELN